MPLYPSWQDIAVRLLLTVIASAAIGLNRGAHGRAAGLRTNILVGLAAAVAMVQMNLLLSVDGKTASSFSVMDIMRLPLGILTGVGFIGGGSILKRGDLVTGVTTAATLWMVTVIGLCFGGGQVALGIGATLVSAAILWPLSWFDARIPRQHRASVAVTRAAADGSMLDLNGIIAPLGYRAEFRRRASTGDGTLSTFWFEVTWTRSDRNGPPADLLAALDAAYEVEQVQLLSESRH